MKSIAGLCLAVSLGGLAYAQGLEWTETAQIGEAGSASVLELADVDGDGLLDVLGATPFGAGGSDRGEIFWLQNPGDVQGTWPKTVVDPSQTYRYTDLRIADFDGDGHVDVLSLSDFGLRIWRNDLGDGSAWSFIDLGFTLLVGRDDIAVGDVDGDGDQDVLLGEPIASNISWYENQNGDGTLWSRHVLSSSFQRFDSMIPLDADGDGDLDVAGAADGVVGWYENTLGDGSAWTLRIIAVPNERIYLRVAADLDGAGGFDLVAIDEDEAVVAYVNASGDGGSWTERELVSADNEAQYLFAGDLDDDGFVDLSVIQSFPDGITSLESLGFGTLDFLRDEVTFDVSFLFPPTDLALADLDGDGATDVVTSRTATSPFGFYTSRPANRFYDPSFRDLVDATINHVPAAVALGDLDGDGDADVVGAYPTVSRLDWWENDGSAGGWTERSVSPADDTTRLATGDVDADGDVDVLTATDTGVQWLENTGVFSSAWSATGIGSVSLASTIEAVDVDSDGDQDVLVAAEGEDAIGWFDNANGDGSAWNLGLIESVAPGASWAKGVDLDGDGDADVLAADAQLNSLAWYANASGQGDSWTLHALATDVTGAERLVPGDFDRDGDLDLAGSGSADALVVLLENSDGAAGTFDRIDLPLASGPPLDIAFSDLDGDGHADLLVATDDVPLWFDAGTSEDPNAWTERALPFDAAFALLSADLDADLQPDVVAVEDLGAIWSSTNGSGFLRYGGPTNPRDSLVLLQGRTEPGNPVVLGIDNPLGTQAAGSQSFLALSLAPAPGFPNGIRLPGFGMNGPGAPGELLLDLSPANLLPPILAGPAWDGTAPAPILVGIPDDASLIGTVVYAQGVLLDASAAFGVRRGLTRGVRIEIVFSLL